VLHHHVQVSLLPNWIGGIQVRNAKLAAGTLTLSAVVTSRKGASSSHVLVWRRPTPG
jgi:Lipocalin-like domain